MRTCGRLQGASPVECGVCAATNCEFHGFGAQCASCRVHESTALIVRTRCAWLQVPPETPHCSAWKLCLSWRPHICPWGWPSPARPPACTSPVWALAAGGTRCVHPRPHPPPPDHACSVPTACWTGACSAGPTFFTCELHACVFGAWECSCTSSGFYSTCRVLQLPGAAGRSQVSPPAAKCILPLP